MGKAAVRALVASFVALGLILALIPPDPASAIRAQTEIEIDEEFPPGNPVIGNNDVVDIEVDQGADRNYALLAGIAVAMIAGGFVLVKLEGWERRRSEKTTKAAI